MKFSKTITAWVFLVVLTLVTFSGCGKTPEEKCEELIRQGEYTEECMKLGMEHVESFFNSSQ